MHRLLVALLAAFDALVAGAVGIAVVLVSVVTLWAFGGAGDASALWPATASAWQLGNLVPLAVHLPTQYAVDAGVAKGAASFALSLAPLAFTGLIVVLAARSGMRAGRSGAWLTGATAATAVYGLVALGVWATGGSHVVTVAGWQAVLLPVVVFGVPSLVGALATAWDDDDGMLGVVHDMIDSLPGRWRGIPELSVRAAVGVLVTLLALGSATVFVALVARGGQIVALYQTANLDAVGGAVVSLGQLAYLPTLIVWAVAFIAGPGFAVGAGTTVSPAGTDLGVLPGIPVLGALPASTSPWLLVVALLPVAAGALAGWMLRGRLPRAAADEPLVRAALAATVAVLAGAGVAGLSTLASGAFGPGRLAQIGPHTGPVALAVAVEVFLGVAAFVLAPSHVDSSTGRGREHATDRRHGGRTVSSGAAPGDTRASSASSSHAVRVTAVWPPASRGRADDEPTEPVDAGFFAARDDRA